MYVDPSGHFAVLPLPIGPIPPYSVTPQVASAGIYVNNPPSIQQNNVMETPIANLGVLVKGIMIYEAYISDKIINTIFPGLSESEEQSHIILSTSGGAYKDVPKNGGENHHMPADSVSPYSRDKGPALNMEKNDHRETASWGNSKEAQKYRKQQQELINQGKFKEAQKMDIKDIQSKFGNKYDKGIEELEDYTDKLLNR